MVSGDWHGDLTFAQRAIKATRAMGMTHLIQLGDFGFWPGVAGKRYIEEVSQASTLAGVAVLVIDGNHEDHYQLEDLVEKHGRFEPIPVMGNVFYLPRGCRFDLNDVRFGALGGAVSIDKGRRTLGLSWWPGEDIKQADLLALGDDPLDILLTHDSPATGQIDMAINSQMTPWLGQELQRASQSNRKAVLTAALATRPKHLLHGHHHVYLQDTISSGEFSFLSEGIAANTSGWSIAVRVLDLERPHLATEAPTRR